MKVRPLIIDKATLELLHSQSGWLVTVSSIARAAQLPRARLERQLARYVAKWDAQVTRVDREAGSTREPVIPLRWLDAILWSIQRETIPLQHLRASWHDAFVRWLKSPAGDPKYAHQLARETAWFRAELAAAHDQIATLTKKFSDLNHAHVALQNRIASEAGRPFARLVVGRYGRTEPFGYEEFAAIRRATDISIKDLAARYGCTEKTIKQIRDSSYPSREFRRWLAEQGLPGAGANSNISRTRAMLGWRHDPPEWVRVLAEACDLESQVRVANRLQLSAATVNLVLAGKYPGNLANVEARVRDVLLNEDQNPVFKSGDAVFPAGGALGGGPPTQSRQPGKETL